MTSGDGARPRYPLSPPPSGHTRGRPCRNDPWATGRGAPVRACDQVAPEPPPALPGRPAEESATPPVAPPLQPLLTLTSDCAQQPAPAFSHPTPGPLQFVLSLAAPCTLASPAAGAGGRLGASGAALFDIVNIAAPRARRPGSTSGTTGAESCAAGVTKLYIQEMRGKPRPPKLSNSGGNTRKLAGDGRRGQTPRLHRPSRGDGLARGV
jgi:hypothetical protein